MSLPTIDELLYGEEETSGNVHDDKGGRRTHETGRAGEIPGEQQGQELDKEAETRSRNPDGTFAEEKEDEFDFRI